MSHSHTLLLGLALLAIGGVCSANAYQQDAGADGIVAVEAENFDADTAQGGHAWDPASASGQSGSGALQALPNTSTNNNTGYTSNSPRLDYQVNFVRTGIHYIWVRGSGATGKDDSLHVGLDGVGIPTSDRITGFGPALGWANATMDGPIATLNVTSTGVHTLNVWMREDGTLIDKFVLTTNPNFSPTGAGPAESPRGSNSTPVAATPVITPAGGDFNDSATVTLSSSTSGASIYYTLDGTTPSADQTTSLIYGGPFSLTASAVVQAIAVANGYTDSPVASASFSVTPAGGGSGAYRQDAGADGIVSVEAENFDADTAQGGHAWDPASASGQSGSGALQALPNTSTNNNTGYTSNSPRLDYQVNFVRTGIHYIWVRGSGATGKDDSLHVGLDGVGIPTSDRITGFGPALGWANATMDGPIATLNITSTGVHTLNVWMREDGTLIDKFVLTTNPNFSPTGAGPAESPRGGTTDSLIFGDGSLNITAFPAGPVITRSTSVTSNNLQPVTYTLTTDRSWLSTSPVTGTTPENALLVTVDPTGLLPGVYMGTVTATADGLTPSTLTIDLTVNANIAYDFESPDLSGWAVVNNASTNVDWKIVNGALHQLTSAGSSVPNVGPSYALGTYMVLDTNTPPSDYRMRCLVTPLSDNGDDVGIMFRYVDDNNYYRLSINSKFGYTRLEKRVNGVFSTLSVTSRGYFKNQQLLLGIQNIGNVVSLYLQDAASSEPLFDGEPLFGFIDQDLSSGSIALYTQGKASFDDVVIEAPGSQPMIALATPPAYTVRTTGAVPVSAVMANVPAGATVTFSLNDTQCTPSSGPIASQSTSQCTGSGASENTVNATLRDQSGGVLAQTRVTAVGTGGDYYVTAGDSITNGSGDHYWPDNVSKPVVVNGLSTGPRMISFRGYQTLLHDLLTTDLGRPNVVFNEGIPGDRSDQLLYDRIDSILERHPDSRDFLILIGFNDALSTLAPMSGLGCSDSACSGTFKGILQAIVDKLLATGKAPVFARIPPIFGPFRGTPYSDPMSAQSNIRVIDYNAVIDEITTENSLRAGPDFFDFFLNATHNRITLSQDNYHPNALGTIAMAYLWRTALGENPDLPFFVDDICVRTNSATCADPALYKQNLLGVGDSYYIDRPYTLTNIPSSLQGGVWISTANDHKYITRSDYLSFTVDRQSEVYVAYNPKAISLPSWLTAFSDTGLSIGVSAGTPTLRLYKKVFPPGIVSLGGNSSSGVSGTINNNFVVIVRPL